MSLVERKSKFTLIGQVKHKNAVEVKAEIIRLLFQEKKPVHTITYDNGREFSAHELVNKCLECQSYFAKPYHSWERGLNENTNGLIRQYFVKGSSFENITNQQVEYVQHKLNNRPRKRLGFLTPNEFLSLNLQKQQVAFNT